MQKTCLLKKVEEQEIIARDYGFYWESMNQLIEQIRSECIEVEEAKEKGEPSHLQEEVGDLIHAAIGLAVYLGFDPHETLLSSIEKFQKRYETVVELAQKDGHANLHNQLFEARMKYWDQAKENLSS